MHEFILNQLIQIQEEGLSPDTPSKEVGTNVKFGVTESWHVWVGDTETCDSPL